MVLGGLWHGAAWTFVIWGAIHGVAQCVGHWRRDRRLARGLVVQSERPAAIWLQRLVTFHIVCFGWIFFDAPTLNDAFTMVDRLFTTWGDPAPLVRFPVIFVIVFALSMQFIPKRWMAAAEVAFARMTVVAKAAVLAAILLMITTLGPPGVAPFIYYKF
jgi:D-alanyl-lipoteichoic acid acyltransferase DltB (MBOAT superfamily)